MKKAITLDENNDLMVRNGSLHLSDTTFQEVALLLPMTQGDHKFKPLLGPNLIQMIKSKVNNLSVQKRIRKHLALDNKDYDELKNALQLNIKS
jgi:hypothetical protein